MHADAPALIWDARQAAGRIRRFTTGRSMEDYLADDLLRSAVERQFEILGEALSALRKVDPATAATIPALGQAVGMRNALIHGYAVVDHSKVWVALSRDLPALAPCLDALAASAPAP